MEIKIKIINVSTLALLLISNLYAGNTISVSVVYPEIREPYKIVFTNIITGIKETPGLSVHEYELKETESTEKLHAWISESKIKSLIALGQHGISQTKNLSPQVSTVIGAVLNPPSNLQGVSGIALSPSPSALFAKLKMLAPKVKSVTTVYNSAVSGWLLPFAQLAAKEHGVTFEAIEAQDIRDAANIYRDIVNKDLGATHAIWLPHDEVTADSKVILPYLLKEAWDKNIVIFSSNPSYVSRGVLFALYPDNIKMGRSLGKLALEAANGATLKNHQVQPLNDLLIAVNIRTAEHLGLRITPSDKRSFDLMFPPPR